MLSSFRVSKPFGEAEIDHIDVVLFLSNSYEEVVGLDVSMQEVPRVDELYSLQLKALDIISYHLVCEHQHCFERKLPLAIVEKILKTRSEEVDHHDVVITFHSEPVDIWDTN